MQRDEIEIRVRYPECDPMGIAHHGVYATWFEMGRTEMLRKTGLSYRDFEADGCFLPIIELRTRYRRPARYDEVLRLVTQVKELSKAKLVFEYELYYGHELLATGETTNACMDREGRVRPMPEVLFKAYEETPAKTAP